MHRASLARPRTGRSAALLVASLVAVLLIAPALPASAATIASFSPQSGPVGTSVSISGHGFQGAKDVLFDNKSVGPGGYTVNSNVSITATVPSGATTGKVSVVAADDTTATSTDDFVVTSGPSVTISSFSPTFGVAGTKVTINGSNFTGATTVMVGTKADPAFTVDSDTKITATVQNGAKSGPVTVTTPNGTGTSATDFTVGTAPMPQIASFTPSSGPVGTKVTIDGTDFTGATSVTFNDVVDPTFKVVSATQITATVPAAATTGPIAVTTPNGTGTSKTDFAVTSPFISSFDPTKGPWGTQVIITGGNLTAATSVGFNGTAATSFSVNSGTQITAKVPNGATTGPISVTSANGTGESADPFTIQHPRTISLALAKHLVASGQVVSTDGTLACIQVVRVKIQRRVSGEWKNVGTGVTTTSGTFRISVPDRDGKYRSFATRTVLSNDDVCRKAKSLPVVS
jgi:hypothetical protein